MVIKDLRKKEEKPPPSEEARVAGKEEEGEKIDPLEFCQSRGPMPWEVPGGQGS